MAYPKGKKRPEGAGRAKGTPNKSTQSLIQICEEEGIDLFRALIRIANDKNHPRSFEAIKEACQYVLPKRKSLEHSGSLDPKMMEAAEEIANKSKEERIEILKAEIEELKK